VNKLSYIWQYIKYLTSAQSKYYLHSPFVYTLTQEVLHDKRYYYAFDAIDYCKKQWLISKQIIEVQDYGAGSKVMDSKKRRVSDIAKYATASNKEGQLLFRLVNYFKPNYVLELGTSLGISTLYLAKAYSKAAVHTLEGCPQTAAVAQQNFKVLQANNVRLHVGTFNELLPKVLQQLPQLDLVLFDGNHKKEPTLLYFEQCLPLVHEKTVFVFDDIYWSAEMTEAWETIKKHPKVRLTIDLFRYGLVFFKQDQAKEHFKILF